MNPKNSEGEMAEVESQPGAGSATPGHGSSLLPTTRDPKEIQRAHDILVAIALGEVPNVFTETETYIWRGVLDALCWVLQHEHNKAFSENLALIEARIKSLGFHLWDSGQLQVRVTRSECEPGVEKQAPEPPDDSAISPEEKPVECQPECDCHLHQAARKFRQNLERAAGGTG